MREFCFLDTRNPYVPANQEGVSSSVYPDMMPFALNCRKAGGGWSEEAERGVGVMVVEMMMVEVMEAVIETE